MKKLAELLAKIESLEGPSYAIDLQIAQTLVPGIIVLRRNGDDTGNEPHTYRKFTASVDDAIWLVGEALPGWSWRVASCCVSDDAWLTPDFNHPVHGKRLVKEFGAVDWDPVSYWQDITGVDLRPSGRPAIALLISLFRALETIGD